VTGLTINGVNYQLNGEYAYKFDTGYQFIDVPQYCNDCEDEDEKPYSYQVMMQEVIFTPLELLGKDYINMCEDDYYNSYQNCFAVPCNTSLYNSVFFQLDSSYMLEVRPEDYILQEKKVPVFDDDGDKTGEEYCTLAFKSNYQSTFNFGVLALQGYAVEFDTTA